jgi:predicted TIM-barrel enzyme
MTGSAPELSKVKKASELASRPILMGSGTNPENVADFLQYADGAIVGSSLKKDGRSENPVDVKIVKRYMDAVNRVRESL